MTIHKYVTAIGSAAGAAALPVLFLCFFANFQSTHSASDF